jgi:hypothetical protein
VSVIECACVRACVRYQGRQPIVRELAAAQRGLAAAAEQQAQVVAGHLRARRRRRLGSNQTSGLI